MEKKTIGKFIAALRKASGMTQRELGDRLFVSDKTVSRWECDECTPDLSLIPSIAEIFGITTDELLRGERNNLDRESSLQSDSHSKQKSKGDKQLKLMLHNKKKRFTNVSLISIGLAVLGLIAAMVCNLGFSMGLLGFCLGSILFVSAAICQISITVSYRMLIDEEEEHVEEIKKANTAMVFASVKILAAVILTWVFCLPLAILYAAEFNSYVGLAFNSWMLYGTVFAFVASVILYILYKTYVIKALESKSIITLTEEKSAMIEAEGRLLKRISIIFIIAGTVILFATYVITSSVEESDFIKSVRFDDPDEFIDYVQEEYDRWYEEGYGDLPEGEIPDNDYELYRAWGEIDGKEYYYNSIMYEDITAVYDENGEWQIVVTTFEDSYNGQQTYDALNAALLALHVINIAFCAVYYLIGMRKIKNSVRS